MWVIYALLSAFGWATSDAFVKAAYRRCYLNEYFVVWVRYLFALPFVLIPFLSVPIPHLDKTFFLWHLVWIPLETTALLLYVKAISISDISIALPFLSLTPLFLIINGYLLIGEKVSELAGAGILLVVAGSYVMGIKNLNKGILAPLKLTFKNRGVQFVILVAFLYSITSISGKMLVLHSSPVFFSFYYTIVMNLVLLGPGILGMRKSEWKKCWIQLVGAGFFYAFMTIFHMTAIRLTLVSYMISVKRLSAIFSVFYGWMLFKEKDILPRLAGSVLMVLGAILITLGS